MNFNPQLEHLVSTKLNYKEKTVAAVCVVCCL